MMANSMTSNKNVDDSLLPPIVIKGYKFFDSFSKQSVLIKGVDYYPRPNTGELDDNNIDFFTEEYRHIWERDIPHFQNLGINAIRLYSVDPDNDHSAFMCALNAAGIYVLVELASGNCKGCAIGSEKVPHCYSPRLKIRGEKIIREFARYSNTLSFSTGNEVNHYVKMGKGPQWNAACLKKFLRDMRAYVKHCDSMRHIPVGLIMADSDRDENTLYYNCQSDGDDLEHAEWYGINTYVYCDANATTFETSVGFKTLADSFESYNYSIPVLLTEFGCLSKTFPSIDGYSAQRSFNQAKWFSAPEVESDFAGGFVFEYSIEAANARTPYPFEQFGPQNYGIGYFSPEMCDDIDVPCEYNLTPSFDNLKKSYAYATANAENVTMDEFRPDPSRIGRTKCPPHFPPLHSFLWKSDFKKSASCPSESAMSFTCQAPTVTSTPNHVVDGQEEGSNHHRFGSFIVAIFLVGITYMFVRLFLLMGNLVKVRSGARRDIWILGRDSHIFEGSEKNNLLATGSTSGYYGSY